MSVSEIGTIGGLIVAILATVIYPLWRDRKAAQDTAIEQAEARALATARSEALIREANAALTAKNVELTAVRAQAADCERARTELRQLLLQCTRQREVPS